MAILGSVFVDQFAGKLINIHPSLLPAFKGLDTHQRAIDAGVKTHGVSIHLVNAALDDGPLILQASLAVAETDTAKVLAGRVLQLEHQIYPFVLLSLAARNVTLLPDGVIWHAKTLAAAPAEMQNVLAPCVIWPDGFIRIAVKSSKCPVDLPRLFGHKSRMIYMTVWGVAGQSAHRYTVLGKRHLSWTQNHSTSRTRRICKSIKISCLRRKSASLRLSQRW